MRKTKSRCMDYGLVPKLRGWNWPSKSKALLPMSMLKKTWRTNPHSFWSTIPFTKWFLSLSTMGNPLSSLLSSLNILMKPGRILVLHFCHEILMKEHKFAFGQALSRNRSDGYDRYSSNLITNLFRWVMSDTIMCRFHTFFF